MLNAECWLRLRMDRRRLGAYDGRHASWLEAGMTKRGAVVWLYADSSAESDSSRESLLGLRQVLPCRTVGLRERHHPYTASGRALRHGLGPVDGFQAQPTSGSC